MSAQRRLRPEDYTVGWLCALFQSEQVAAIKMLDEQHQELPKPVGDDNTYTYGSIGSHNIVIACLPISHPGTTSASRMADLLPTSFPNMRLHLFVGIGGGIPHNPPHLDASQDIHLGDVVVGVAETPGVAGVVQYDFMREKGEDGRDQLGIFDKPNPELLTALGKLFSNYEMGDSNPHSHLAKLTGTRSDFARPPPGGDKFYRSTYKHINGAPNCDQCSIDQEVVRIKRQGSIPLFHQAQILSGNSVIKDAKHRDELSQVYPHARCIEMEAAGVVDQTHCLVIRGIADYADSHKNETWQPYAAGTAAAFARELLLTVQPSVVKELGNIAPTAGQAADPQSSGNLEPGNVHWMVPKKANKLFTGRTRILEKLGHSLASQSPSSSVSEEQKIFVIVGYGGIGKSEVCLKFANDHRQHFWGVFWIDASSEETAKQSFIDIGKLCGGKAETFEQVKTWLANICYSWILIIDNADNPDIDYAIFFPSGEKGNILLTTRNQQCCAHATVGREDLDHLDLQDATSLLFKAAGIAESSRGDNHKAAEKVVQDLSYHTLAIVQAGAFIKLRFCSLEEYPILFKEEAEKLLNYRPIQAQSTYGSVFATFEISATHLGSSQDQNAANALSLLPLLGFFHFQEIPVLMFSRARDEAIAIREKRGRGMPQDEIYRLSELQISRLPEFIMPRNHIATGSSPWQWREILNLLESYSIIKFSGTGEDLSFSMHPLAHTWARSRPGLTPREQSWAAAGSVIALSMRGTNYNMFHEKLRSHVEAYLGYPILEYRAEMTELEICQTHFRICWLVLHLLHTSRLRDLLKILETFEAWTGASGESSLQIKLLTANCFLQEGQHQTAVGLLERLVETNHADDLGLQATLANAYLQCKQHQKAVPLLERLAKIQERTETPDDEYLLRLRHLLGCTYIGNKQFERAAPLLEQVVEIQKGSMVSTHRSRLASEIMLGRAYIGKRQYEKAAKILQQVLDIRCQILDVKDPGLLATQNWLAKAYIGMGNGHYGRAAELLEPVVRKDESFLAPENPDRLASQHELAKAYIGMGNGHYGRAAELLEQVVRAPDDPYRMMSQQLLEEVRGRIEAENDAESTSVSGETT
ncbi:hypothetical protein HO133_000060 [Letharia lupina]|uniref:NB-ARC domain-containing protein n=1 Tax=Letharia lupina TaxID=560253 RepID=A0A8H6FCV6_9LECA|nr:uncharacterized protein HO133_000060 [Letharia lupina]KAF6223218.1 hypothetical protein HO133_000060 [Letharia lupina]